MFDHDLTITPAEIREAWTTIQSGGTPFSEKQRQAGVTARLPEYRSTEVSRFIGCSGAQMQGWLEDGYYVDTGDFQMPSGDAEIANPFVDLVEEDGDLIVSAALGGDDLMYAQWQDMESRRGLTIRACVGMHAGTDASVLAAYYGWILKVVQAAEARGVAPDVELYFTARNPYVRSKGTLRVRVPLVKGGEIVDAVAWRAFLTPGAFRSLGFVALGLAADRIGRGLSAGMGAPMNKSWRVEFTDDVLDVECPGGAESFPDEAMDMKLEKAYAGA
jgi:hypothetical protein